MVQVRFMELKERFTGLDQKYKIGLVVLVVLSTGFVADSVNTAISPGSNSHTDTLERQQKLSYDAGVPTEAGAGGDSTSDVSRDFKDQSSDRKIITTVRTTLKVNDVSKAQGGTTQFVERYNGFIGSSSIDQRDEVSGRMTVSIPDENLSEFRGELKQSYRVESESTDRTDVTDQYNELESELETKKQEMQQLKELMNQTDNVSDMVKIQERMSELRSRIDYLQKKLDDLDERIEYSRVYITFEGPELLRASFNLRQTLFQAYRAVFESIRSMILGAAYLLPFAILAGLYKLLRGRVEL